jgi:D-arabinitol 4-dehydrogenase
VVENNFRDARPNLEAVGVEMVESVIPYEEAKIRILNASHSCIAWAGTLIGQQYIHESTLTDVIYAIADRYVTEDVIPASAITALICRPTAMWCSSALPTPYPGHQPARRRRRLLENSGDDRANLAGVLSARRPEATAMLPALFFVFMEQWHKGTLPYQYQDGILDAQAVHEMYEAQDPVAVFARDKALFGDLANNADFLALMREKVAAVYTLIK